MKAIIICVLCLFTSCTHIRAKWTSHELPVTNCDFACEHQFFLVPSHEFGTKIKRATKSEQVASIYADNKHPVIRLPRGTKIRLVKLPYCKCYPYDWFGTRLYHFSPIFESEKLGKFLYETSGVFSNKELNNEESMNEFIEVVHNEFSTMQEGKVHKN